MATEEEMMFDTDEVVSLDEKGDTLIESDNKIINYVINKFTRAEDARSSDEERWLRAYKNYRGIYGSDVQFTETEKSRVFVKVTKTKTLSAYGQIIEVLFGTTKFPLTIDPTTLPDGVADSVHINVDPNAEKGMDELGHPEGEDKSMDEMDDEKGMDEGDYDKQEEDLELDDSVIF